MPQFSAWCPSCNVSPPDAAIKKVLALQDTFFANKNTCGDKVCNVANGESCTTCPGDCGACSFTSAITSCVNKNQIHFTFDDGPTEMFPKFLDILKSSQIKASIYINGLYVMQSIDPNSVVGKETGWTNSILASYVKRAYDEGHIIGTHTYSHLGVVNGTVSTPNFTLNSVKLDVLRMQMLMNDILIYDIIGKYPLAFRPPYLEMNGTILNLLETMGYIPISVNVDSKDYEATSSDIVVSNVMADISKSPNDGMIGLFHDGYSFTIEALPKLITQVKAKGITFVDLPTCLNKPASAFYRSTNANLFTKDMQSAQGVNNPSTISSTTSTTSTTTSATTSTTTKPSSSTTPLAPSSKNTNINGIQSSASSLTGAMDYVLDILSVFLVTIGFF
ncbi:chitin deacetylase [Coelomomyces lativittatus]|nr:chitin deacetylase [Coelomomyces lativittatus]KAJ1513530.1 chitin deacetylase [Coelomomyces lativittatus]